MLQAHPVVAEKSEQERIFADALLRRRCIWLVVSGAGLRVVMLAEQADGVGRDAKARVKMPSLHNLPDCGHEWGTRLPALHMRATWKLFPVFLCVAAVGRRATGRRTLFISILLSLEREERVNPFYNEQPFQEGSGKGGRIEDWPTH
jgi:hypothetical protein